MAKFFTSDFEKYGDFRNLKPTGASDSTAKQDGLVEVGVSASNKMLDTDIKELSGQKDCYYKVGKKLGIHPALIAALASRESRGGRLLRATSGYGDKGRAYGILQCDLNTSGFGDQCLKFNWDSCELIEFMIANVFLPMLINVQKKKTDWTPEQQLQGAVAAFNFGVKNVQTWAGIDRGTTGNDYSNDVIARAQRLQKYHNWN